MRLLLASGSYLVFHTIWGPCALGALASLVLALMYEPIPSDVDNFLSTYVIIKINKINDLVGKVRGCLLKLCEFSFRLEISKKS